MPKVLIIGSDPLFNFCMRVVLEENGFEECFWTESRLKKDNPKKLFTDREVAVLALVEDGCSNRQVAEKLEITEYTVKDHLKHIYKKSGTTSRQQLIRESRMNGYVAQQLHRNA